ncbi:histidinol-phosphatase (PHP family) [Paenibacillus jamilae]|jgi:histidinol-phosphatase (PHP family)|uniref:histidinol-phosphatase HisJ n=1 Tax=Paenibacillus polymyxa TaxID=1406 RepID=UPI00129A97FB|nr:histidinol-phosphatase HisJ [Paenibacillus polymyxa]MDP9678606.1 histidinol-phosphatase (PHP family) [Paenibacillus jamilae]KAE8560916.1 histidinol-phosphatase [Paenibacillus polymyxa]MBY0023056.1 histidinol-phosphatase HisJ [Paenibacillus polymyxa]MBY0059712.1 histidinol-phosphatase HisJ [Paenibacillus polymyxa]MBY0069206.1 histidinol-phosphatase HisJ [Paenibacillus polymyxa]
MKIDYHTHHSRCGHAIGSLEEYVQQGIRLGLDQLGLSDHMPLVHVEPANYYPEMAMPMDELPRYVEECLELKERYKGQIDIRVGLEGDYIEGWEREIEDIIHAYPWDYVIGSVHFLGEWDVTDFRQVHHWEGKNVLEVYRTYYDAVSKAAATGLYDIMGHLDVIKRFGHHPKPEEKEELRELERSALSAVARSGRAMELNASGLSKPCAEMFPSRRMLGEAFTLGIPLTIGSDAHDPAKLAEHLEKARALLYEVGYRELAVFQHRERSRVPLAL